MRNFLGIDVGTSGVRAAVYNESGKRLALFHREYSLSTDAGGKAELDAEQIVQALTLTVRACTQKYTVFAAGLGAFMHGILAADEKGCALTGAITWMDSRAAPQAAQLGFRRDIEELNLVTGCRLSHPMYPLSKLLWLKQNQPELFDRAAHFMTLKQYIIYRLFGTNVVDYADASATGLFNMKEFCWEPRIVRDILEVPEEKLGRPQGPEFILRDMRPDYAGAMGLPAGVPFVLGATDGVLAHVGSGSLARRRISSTIGTSGALRAAINKPPHDPSRALWCYAYDKKTWITGGAISNGGIILKWIGSLFDRKPSYTQLDALAAQASPGCQGLSVIPTLGPERNPDYNAQTTAALHGLRLSHGKPELVRAAMEGVMYRMYDMYLCMGEAGAGFAGITATGGYASSPFWLQMQADIFGCEIYVPRENESSVFGAAYLAMQVLGYDGVQETPEAMRAQRVIAPDKDNATVYREGYERYKEFYHRLYRGI